MLGAISSGSVHAAYARFAVDPAAAKQRRLEEKPESASDHSGFGARNEDAVTIQFSSQAQALAQQDRSAAVGVEV